jgi:hypothetical protein
MHFLLVDPHFIESAKALTAYRASSYLLVAFAPFEKIYYRPYVKSNHAHTLLLLLITALYRI